MRIIFGRKTRSCAASKLEIEQIAKSILAIGNQDFDMIRELNF